MNIENLSIEQLADLRDKVIVLLNDRVSAKQKELQAEIERFGSLASMQKQKAPKTSPAKTKYQKGDQTWSGRGTSPAWVKQHLALGGTMTDLEVRGYSWVAAAPPQARCLMSPRVSYNKRRYGRRPNGGWAFGVWSPCDGGDSGSGRVRPQTLAAGLFVLFSF